MLGVSRVIIYLCDSAPAWIDSQVHGRFRAIQGDISSLSEFQQQLNDRLQFMLDAVLGFIQPIPAHARLRLTPLCRPRTGATLRSRA
jgi:magnesium transporter